MPCRERESFRTHCRIYHSFTCWCNFRLRYIQKPQWQDLCRQAVMPWCRLLVIIRQEVWNLMPSFSGLSFMFMQFVNACLSWPRSICFKLTSCTQQLFLPPTNKQPKTAPPLQPRASTYMSFINPKLFMWLLTVYWSCQLAYSLQYKGMFRAVWDWSAMKVRENEFREKRYKCRVVWMC